MILKSHVQAIGKKAFEMLSYEVWIRWSIQIPYKLDQDDICVHARVVWNYFIVGPSYFLFFKRASGFTEQTSTVRPTWMAHLSSVKCSLFWILTNVPNLEELSKIKKRPFLWHNFAWTLETEISLNLISHSWPLPSLMVSLSPLNVITNRFLCVCFYEVILSNRI